MPSRHRANTMSSPRDVAPARSRAQERCRVNTTPCQNGVVTRRRRVNTTSCQDDTVSRRCGLETAPCQDGFVSKRCRTKTTWPQGDPASRWRCLKHDIVSRRCRCQKKRCRGNTVPCKWDTMSRRCHAKHCRVSTTSCQDGIVPKTAPYQNGVVPT